MNKKSAEILFNSASLLNLLKERSTMTEELTQGIKHLERQVANALNSIVIETKD